MLFRIEIFVKKVSGTLMLENKYKFFEMSFLSELIKAGSHKEQSFLVFLNVSNK